jgi:GDP-mannose 6-dehydrogenase
MISVGTPPTSSGALSLEHVERVIAQIAQDSIQRSAAPVVILRSTVPPGTLDRCASLLAAAAPGVDFHLCFNPEFLREGSAVKDFMEPAITVIGTGDGRAEELVRELYADLPAPIHVVEPRVAELLKCVANSWHATKITFANEIGRLARGLGMDGREIMRLIVEDHKLNVSPAYMRPGFAFGGSCLPKDLASILQHAQAMNIPTPLLQGVRDSNRRQIDTVAEEIISSGARSIGVLGLAFKSNTDDLRDSPAVVLCKTLIGEGITLKIFDRAVSAARLMGSNLAYIRANLPHFESLLVESPVDAVRDAELVAVTYASPEFSEALSAASPTTEIFDLAGLAEVPAARERYRGIAW